MGKIFGKTYWFEISVSDLVNAKAFYSEVLGWRFQKLMRTELLNYWMIEVDGVFIGGLRKGKPEEKQGETPVIYFFVDNLASTINKARALGAIVEGERVDLGLKRGCFQRLRDPDQNLIALWADE